MTTTEALSAVLLVAGMFGVVGWMVTRLVTAYREERARQAPEQRSSPLLTIVVAIGVYAALAWATDYRTAFSLALAGIAGVALINRLRSRAPKR